MKTKMLISKALLLEMKQHCLDKLDDDATPHEVYLAGDYEFSNRVRDALRHKDIKFEGFTDATLDAIEAAVDRYEALLADARDDHDRYTARQLFEGRAFDAIMRELKADVHKAPEPVADAPKIEVVAAKPPKPAPGSAAVASFDPPLATQAPITPAERATDDSKPAPVVVEARPRVQVEVIDRQEVPDVIPNVAEELTRAFAKPLPVTTDKSEPVSTPYTKYEQRLGDAWKQPPPLPKKRKKGVHDADLL